MKVRRLTRNYGFGGYSIYRYLVSEAPYKGEYFLPWCEETARAVALLLECLFGRHYPDRGRLRTGRPVQ